MKRKLSEETALKLSGAITTPAVLVIIVIFSHHIFVVIQDGWFENPISVCFLIVLMLSAAASWGWVLGKKSARIAALRSELRAEEEEAEY